MIEIKDIMILDTRDVSETNIKNKVLDKKCFDWDNSSKVLQMKYGYASFDAIIGLCNNIRRDNNKLYCDIMLYDVNGFDIEMPDFIKAGLSSNAFNVKPLIKVITETSGVITKAKIVDFGLVM